MSLPRGGVASVSNSTLLIVCPIGTYSNGPAQFKCNKLTVSKCESTSPYYSVVYAYCEIFFSECRSIKYCLKTFCTSASLSICLKCIDQHPIWNIPVVVNRRRRKCRSNREISLHNFYHNSSQLVSQ